MTHFDEDLSRIRDLDGVDVHLKIEDVNRSMVPKLKVLYLSKDLHVVWDGTFGTCVKFKGISMGWHQKVAVVADVHDGMQMEFVIGSGGLDMNDSFDKEYLAELQRVGVKVTVVPTDSFGAAIDAQGFVTSHEGP
jgi:hypothetical protein